MPLPRVGKTCGSRGFDSSRCKSSEFAECSDMSALGAQYRDLAVRRGSLVAIERGQNRGTLPARLGNVRRAGDDFWKTYPYDTAICREADPKNPSITRSWKLFRLPSEAEEKAPVSRDSGADFDVYTRPFKKSLGDLMHGDYEGAYKRLGKEKATIAGAVAGATLVGVIYAAWRFVKRLGRRGKEADADTKKSETEAARANRTQAEKTAPPPKSAPTFTPAPAPRSTPIPPSAPPSSRTPVPRSTPVPPSAAAPSIDERVSLVVDDSAKGVDETMGVEQLLAELGIGTKPESEPKPKPEFTQTRYDIVNPTVDPLARMMELSPEAVDRVFMALRSLTVMDGGVSMLDRYQQNLGMELAVPAWKMSVLLVQKYMPHADATLSATMTRMLIDAAKIAKTDGRDGFGLYQLVEAIEMSSGQDLDMHEVRAYLLYYSEWMRSEIIEAPYSGTMGGDGDSILLVRKREIPPPFDSDTMEELRAIGIDTAMAAKHQAFIKLRSTAWARLSAEEKRVSGGSRGAYLRMAFRIYKGIELPVIPKASAGPDALARGAAEEMARAPQPSRPGGERISGAPQTPRGAHLRVVTPEGELRLPKLPPAGKK